MHSQARGGDKAADLSHIIMRENKCLAESLSIGDTRGSRNMSFILSYVVIKLRAVAHQAQNIALEA